MTNLSLQDRFSLISLNALNSTRNSTAKKAAIRCISAAGVLDRFLQETEELTEDSDEYRSRLDALSVSLKEAAHLSSSAAKELEHTVYTRLNNLGLMTEASSLDHKSADHTVECQSVIKSFLYKRYKIFHCVRCDLRI